MNDLEERLRAEMRHATAQIRDDLDLDSVMTSGDRVVKGRTIRRSLGVVATVVAVGLIAFAGFANRPVVGIPAPAATMSGSTTPAATPDGRSWAKLTIPSSAQGGDPQITVRATRASGGYDVASEVTDPNGVVQELTGHATPQRPALLRITSSEWVLVTAGTPSWVQATQSGGGEWWPQDDEPLKFPGLAARAVVVKTWDESATLAGVLWADEAGDIRDQEGRTVPHVSLRMNGRKFSFVRAAALGLACSAEVVRGTLMVEDCSVPDRVPAGSEPNLIEASGGCGERDGNCYGGYPEFFSYVVLPEGSSEGITFDFVNGANCAVANGRIGTTGPFVYMVRCTGQADSKDQTFTAAHYRDAAGNPATFRP